jgi:hypothetical protein
MNQPTTYVPNETKKAHVTVVVVVVVSQSFVVCLPFWLIYFHLPHGVALHLQGLVREPVLLQRRPVLRIHGPHRRRLAHPHGLLHEQLVLWPRGGDGDQL